MKEEDAKSTWHERKRYKQMFCTLAKDGLSYSRSAQYPARSRTWELNWGNGAVEGKS